MALNATIYKVTVHLSDFNNSRFENLSLTVALHPSETISRMIARILAYCFHASNELEFTKGLSTPDCPDLWEINLQGDIVKWIEIGEPGFEKIKKACRYADEVWVYSFNPKSSVWWQQSAESFAALPVRVVQLEAAPLQAFADAVTRTLTLNVSIVDGEISLITDTTQCSLKFEVLQG